MNATSSRRWYARAVSSVSPIPALRYQRSDERGGYRNGTRRRTLTAQSGPFTMQVPRGVLVASDGNLHTPSCAPLFQLDGSLAGELGVR